VIWYLPIEPLDERYTEQWYRWFPEEFARQRAECRTIDGEALSNEIQVGTFLDVNSTLHYKATQLRKVARLFHEGTIKNKDLFFVADVEFWGIESIRYLATLNGVDVKMAGFVHAGSYTREDFMEKCAPFARHYERGWGAVFDLLFVGSEYHKGQLAERRGVPDSKIVVSGNPYKLGELGELVGAQNGAKENLIILTNRPDFEKRPGVSLTVFESLKLRHPDWRFLVTTSRRQWGAGELRERALELQRRGVIEIREGISKREYLCLLSRAKVMVSNTIEENFGYCVLEAMALDTIPIVPFGFSHPQLLDGERRCMFEAHDLEEQVRLIEDAIAFPFSVRGHALKYEKSLAEIVRWCMELQNV
jgi:glycosyltransferase involved in cell wall biosynthesis